ncbi:DUF6141 family protein [Virgibacillus necropolis]|uniref:DUF6141 family protein n=1 Tax=Virgibacillus necropolis TaxID=163877 RepID=UPI00268850C0
MSKTNEDILYLEVQKLGRPWIIGVLLIASIFWWGFIQQVIFGIRFGDEPVGNGMQVFTWLVFGIILPWGAFKMKLITEVRRDGLFIRLVPFHFRYRRFPSEELLLIKTITYSPDGAFWRMGNSYKFQGRASL